MEQQNESKIKKEKNTPESFPLLATHAGCDLDNKNKRTKPYRKIFICKLLEKEQKLKCVKLEQRTKVKI